MTKISRSFCYDDKLTWPRGEKYQVILEPDTAIELGHPQTESLSFHMWTESPEQIQDNQIKIIGREINEIKEKQIPFGKIVMIAGHGFNDDNAYERYEEMDLIRLKLNLEGYMLRAIPQQNIEWSRISHKAMQSGFSLRVLGNELIKAYKDLEYVDAVEVLFITSSDVDIRSFKKVGEKVEKIVQAMDKIYDNLEYNCGSCNFKDVCDEIEGLKSMHKKSQKA